MARVIAEYSQGNKDLKCSYTAVDIIINTSSRCHIVVGMRTPRRMSRSGPSQPRNMTSLHLDHVHQ